MEFLKYFKAYMLNEEEGLGNNYFHVKKMDKSYDYFFKIGDKSEHERAFIIKIGKFSKNDIINDTEQSYAVLSIEEISPESMDAFLIDEAPFKSTENEMISVTMDELTKISNILERALDDYLEKSPKVTKIYDEFLENIEIGTEEYVNFTKNTISIWSKGRWNTQSGSNPKSILHTKLSHN